MSVDEILMMFITGGLSIPRGPESYVGTWRNDLPWHWAAGIGNEDYQKFLTFFSSRHHLYRLLELTGFLLIRCK